MTFRSFSAKGPRGLLRVGPQAACVQARPTQPSAWLLRTPSAGEEAGEVEGQYPILSPQPRRRHPSVYAVPWEPTCRPALEAVGCLWEELAGRTRGRPECWVLGWPEPLEGVDSPCWPLGLDLSS